MNLAKLRLGGRIADEVIAHLSGLVESSVTRSSNSGV